MHISKLSLVNYRNFANTNLAFNAGINTILGENGSGKSNAFRAIRLLLDANMLPSAYRINQDDFHRGLSDWRGHWIIISLEFEDVSADESIQALFVHGTGRLGTTPIERAAYNLIYRPKKEIRIKLSEITEGDISALQAFRSNITAEDYETVFTGRNTADFNDPQVYKKIVGDFDLAKFDDQSNADLVGVQLPKQLSVAREISFTHIQTLRDVVSDFQNNRTNPLKTLLKHKSGEIDPTDFKSITDKVIELNQEIEKWPDVGEVRTDVQNMILDTVGVAYSPSSLSISSELPGDADRLFQSLKLFVGEHGEEHEGAVHDLSLGAANLIYLTLKLLEFKYQKANQSVANFLLVEEPEAHIHTHIQRTLFDRLNYPDTQVIYSTHSTQISDVSNISSMNILGREGKTCEAYQPANGLNAKQVRNLQRYLDAIRSNLLFAKSVLLVEGDAEEILIPILVRKVLGISLDELGVSLINIRSTGFENVASIFDDKRVRKNCSIITDMDAAILDTTSDPTDDSATKKYKQRVAASHKSGKERHAEMEAFISGNQWTKAFYADHTFEVDLVKAGNSELFTKIVEDIYDKPATIKLAKFELGSADVAKYGRRALRMANNAKKGWFAILLGGEVDEHSVIPKYILEALKFAHPEFSAQTLYNILAYRLNISLRNGTCTAEDGTTYRDHLDEFHTGKIDFRSIRTHTATLLSGDVINNLLEVY